MKYHAFLIKYAEIGIKGKNRYLFEDALVKHIRLAMERVEGEFEVKTDVAKTGTGYEASCGSGHPVIAFL